MVVNSSLTGAHPQMGWISGLEASNRSETVRNRKYGQFRIFPMVKIFFLAHLTKKLDDFEKKNLIFLKFLKKSGISLVNHYRIL